MSKFWGLGSRRDPGKEIENGGREGDGGGG